MASSTSRNLSCYVVLVYYITCTVLSRKYCLASGVARCALSFVLNQSTVYSFSNGIRLRLPFPPTRLSSPLGFRGSVVLGVEAASRFLGDARTAIVVCKLLSYPRSHEPVVGSFGYQGFQRLSTSFSEMPLIPGVFGRSTFVCSLVLKLCTSWYYYAVIEWKVYVF